MTDDKNKKERFYNIDAFINETRKGPDTRGPILGRAWWKIVRAFDPLMGFWISVSGAALILLLPFVLLFSGLFYGAVGFYATTAVALGLGTFVLEKKHGAHLQVEDYPLLKRLLLLVPVFLVVLGVWLLVLYLRGLI